MYISHYSFAYKMKICSYSNSRFYWTGYWSRNVRNIECINSLKVFAIMHIKWRYIIFS